MRPGVGPGSLHFNTRLCTTNTIFMSLKWDLLLYFITKNRIRKCKQDPTGPETLLFIISSKNKLIYNENSKITWKGSKDKIWTFILTCLGFI